MRLKSSNNEVSFCWWVASTTGTRRYWRLTMRNPAVGAVLAVPDVQLARCEALAGTARHRASDTLQKQINTQITKK